MEAVLYVPHQRYNKMVGKIFVYRTSAGARNCFFHEESGSQGHYLAESPGGIDCCVVARLRDYHIETIFHKQKGKDGKMWTTTNTMLMDLGIRRFEDQRRRVFLPWGNWREVTVRLYIPFIKGKDVFLNPADDYMEEQEPTSSPTFTGQEKRKYRKQRDGAEDARELAMHTAWHPIAPHPCLSCGTQTAQSGPCIICQAGVPA